MSHIATGLCAAWLLIRHEILKWNKNGWKTHDRKRIQQILQEKETKNALQILNEDFTEHDGVGASRVAEFITGGKDDDIQADVVGFARQLIDLCS